MSLLSGLESGAAAAKSGIPEGHPDPPPAVSVSSEDLRVVRGPSRKRVDRCDLRNPHLPEVDGRVAGLPSLQKPLDWRVKRNRVQLVNVKCAMTTDGGVLGRDILERPGDVRREDDVQHVLSFRCLVGRDRIDQCDGAFERYVTAFREEPRLLPQLPPQSADQALARSDTASRKEPHLIHPFLVPEQQDPSAPAEDRRDANARLHAQCADDPKPCPPRSLAASSSTSTRRTAAIGATTS